MGRREKNESRSGALEVCGVFGAVYVQDERERLNVQESHLAGGMNSK